MDTKPSATGRNIRKQKQEVIMKQVIIYASPGDPIITAVASLTDFHVKLLELNETPGIADCALISQQYAGNQTAAIISRVKEARIPCAIAAFSPTADVQEHFLSSGADDVLIFPMCSRLLRKRLLSLADIPVLSDAEVGFAAFDRILEANSGSGCFIVAEQDFMNIYRFVTRLLERLDKKAYLIHFRFDCDDDAYLESDSIYNFLKVLQTSLRRGDISSVYGKELFVILMGADENAAKAVIHRLISTFNAHYNMDESCEITYETREINGAQNL